MEQETDELVPTADMDAVDEPDLVEVASDALAPVLLPMVDILGDLEAMRVVNAGSQDGD